MGLCASKEEEKPTPPPPAAASPEPVKTEPQPATPVPAPAPAAAANDFAVDVPLGDALAEILRLDHNGLRPGEEYELDVQGYTTYGNKGRDDWAGRPLFKHVVDDVLDRPTYKAFAALLDNYTRDVGTAEQRTGEELAEEREFLNAVMATAPVQYAHSYLAHRDLAPQGDGAWRDMLQTLWFKLYRSTKGGPDDSCGFEHVFVGEEKERGRRSELTGFHNWIQLWLEEKAGRLDYHGYVSRDRKRPAPTARVMSLQFSATDAGDGSVACKPVSTSFFGVSPEFEIALYTVAALAGEEGGKNTAHMRVEDDDVEITTITWRRGREVMMRTAYPGM